MNNRTGTGVIAGRLARCCATPSLANQSHPNNSDWCAHMALLSANSVDREKKATTTTTASSSSQQFASFFRASPTPIVWYRWICKTNLSFLPWKKQQQPTNWLYKYSIKRKKKCRDVSPVVVTPWCGFNIFWTNDRNQQKKTRRRVKEEEEE